MKVMTGDFESRRETFGKQRYVNTPRKRKKRSQQPSKPFRDYFNGGDDAS